MVRADGTAEVGQRTEKEGEAGRPKSVSGHPWNEEGYPGDGYHFAEWVIPRQTRLSPRYCPRPVSTSTNLESLSI